MGTWGQTEEPHTEQFAMDKENFAIQICPIFNDCKRIFLAWGLGWHINVYCGCQKYSLFHFFYRFQLFFEANSLTLSHVWSQWYYWKFSNVSSSNFLIRKIQVLVNSSGGIYKRCYFCLSQLPKIKKESTANTFHGQRSRGGHKEPVGLTVNQMYV